MQPACGSVRLTVRPSDSKDVASSEDVATQKVRLSSAECTESRQSDDFLGAVHRFQQAQCGGVLQMGDRIALRR